MEAYRLEMNGSGGKPAIFNKRGLVCVFEAGYQQTREDDARAVVSALNAAPDLLAALVECLGVFEKQRELIASGARDIPCPRNEALNNHRAAIARARGGE
jgi:hypothetical protein